MAINLPQGTAFEENTGLALGGDVDPILFKESMNKNFH